MTNDNAWHPEGLMPWTTYHGNTNAGWSQYLNYVQYPEALNYISWQPEGENRWAVQRGRSTRGSPRVDGVRTLLLLFCSRSNGSDPVANSRCGSTRTLCRPKSRTLHQETVLPIAKVSSNVLIKHWPIIHMFVIYPLKTLTNHTHVCYISS
jgi:hypothetical protein